MRLCTRTRGGVSNDYPKRLPVNLVGSSTAMIAGGVMSGATHFLHAQRMLIVASQSAQERLWALIVFWHSGIISAHDDRQSVTIDWTLAFDADRDTLWTNLKVSASLGLWNPLHIARLCHMMASHTRS